MVEITLTLLILVLKLIPDGDRQMRPNVPLPPIHEDVTVTNQLSRLIVSFRWRNLLTDKSIKYDISRWLQETAAPESLELDANYPPNFILIGV